MNASKHLLILIVLVTMVGCTLRPDLITAYIKNGGEMETIEVTLRSKDAKAIKDREMYFSIVVFDCDNSQKDYNVWPHVAGRRASKFDFPIEGEYVTFHGVIPKRIVDSYSKPCAFLSGGSYFFGTIESKYIHLVRKSGVASGVIYDPENEHFQGKYVREN